MVYIFKKFYTEVKQGYPMGFHIHEYFMPLCFHHIDELSESKVFFWVGSKEKWQLCSNFFMLLIIPKLNKVLNARLHLWTMQWTLMENGA